MAYDPKTGFASIGYNKPARRLIAISNGREIYDDDFDAPFETASVANNAAARRQMDHNQAGADYATANAQALQQENAMPSPASMLAQRYAQNKPPSYARMGDEFSINGKPVTSTFSADASGAGMDEDAYRDSLYNPAKEKYNNDFRNRMTGDNLAGTSESSALFNDPDFIRLPDQQKASVYKQINGRGLAYDLDADKMGGNMTVNQFNKKRDTPERAANAAKRMAQIKSFYGEDPAAILGGVYDPSTETVEIAGEVKINDMGQSIQQPSKRIKVPFAEWDELNEIRAHMNGFNGAEQMKRGNPEITERDALILKARGSKTLPPHDKFMAKYDEGQRAKETDQRIANQPNGGTLPYGVNPVQTSRQKLQDDFAKEAKQFAARRAADQRQKNNSALGDMRRHQAGEEAIKGYNRGTPDTASAYW